MTLDFYGIFSKIVCPSLGAIMATLMFGAPVMDLRKALLRGKLGDLNPFPWMMMTGNCLGWVVYGYYLDPQDAFIVAANLPGLIISLWLNFGAAKLQYKELYASIQEREEKEDSSSSSSSHHGRTKLPEFSNQPSQKIHSSSGSTSPTSVMVVGGVTEEELEREKRLRLKKLRRQRRKELQQYNPDNLVSVAQERGLLRVLSVWIVVLVYIQWLGDPRQVAVSTIGIVVNLNLVFFYGAPLQTMSRVIFQDRHSNTIHRPTMYMSLACSSFSFMYGAAKLDPVIMLPNAIGITLGLAQLLLCFCFPRRDIPEDEDVQNDGGNNNHVDANDMGRALIMTVGSDEEMATTIPTGSKNNLHARPTISHPYDPSAVVHHHDDNNHNVAVANGVNGNHYVLTNGGGIHKE